IDLRAQGGELRRHRQLAQLLLAPLQHQDSPPVLVEAEDDDQRGRHHGHQGEDQRRVANRLRRDHDGAVATRIRVQDRWAAEEQRADLGEQDGQYGQTRERPQGLQRDAPRPPVFGEAAEYGVPQDQRQRGVKDRYDDGEQAALPVTKERELQHRDVQPDAETAAVDEQRLVAPRDGIRHDQCRVVDRYQL